MLVKELNGTCVRGEAQTRRKHTAREHKTTDAKKTRPRNKTQGVLSSMSRNRPVSECTTPTESATVQWHHSHGEEWEEERIQWERRRSPWLQTGVLWAWIGQRKSQRLTNCQQTQVAIFTSQGPLCDDCPSTPHSISVCIRRPS